MTKLNMLVLISFLLMMLFLAGCQQKVESNENLGAGGNEMQNTPTEPAPSESSALDIAYRELGCKTADECNNFCEANHEICDKFCDEYPDVCNAMRPENVGVMVSEKEKAMTAALSQCRQETIIQKMKAVIDSALVNPPEEIHEVNWMTKILPANNPYPGYYYDISTAFGPAIDEAVTKGQEWSGEGEPPMVAGKFHYSFGFWDEVPKGKGAALGQETPESMDFSKYQLAIFYTDKTGSQDSMINALPPLAMTESEAKEFFYSVFKKSFISLDQKTLAKKGTKFYEVQWKDSDKTNDYWDVQIGEGYITIGQGKVYSEESSLAGNVGTVWLYTGCRPCAGCEEWTKETAFNKDCTENSDCKSGLSCNGGYCVESAPDQGAQPAQSGGGGPGSSCSTSGDCGSGLSCKNSVCSIPTGGPG
jgi:hypothetical protein